MTTTTDVIGMDLSKTPLVKVHRVCSAAVSDYVRWQKHGPAVAPLNPEHVLVLKLMTEVPRYYEELCKYHEKQLEVFGER